MKDLIQIVIIIFPNATVFFTDNLTEEHYKKIIENWDKKYAKEKKYKGTTKAIASIYMPRNDYDKIIATSESQWLTGI
jgi:hypothetical protein